MKKRILGLLLAAILLISLLSLPTFAAEVVDSGTCGENLTWALTENICDCGISYHDYTLTISGTGPMKDFNIAPLRASSMARMSKR